MPGVYKKKECPVCKVIHRRRGPYCSKSCAAKDRECSEEVKNKISQSMSEYYKTPQGITAAKRAGIRWEALRKGDSHDLVKSEEFAVDIPDVQTLSDFDEFLEGFDRGENW